MDSDAFWIAKKNCMIITGLIDVDPCHAPRQVFKCFLAGPLRKAQRRCNDRRTTVAAGPKPGLRHNENPPPKQLGGVNYNGAEIAFNSRRCSVV